jgi:hypothetical protein
MVGLLIMVYVFVKKLMETFLSEFLNLNQFIYIQTN